MNGQPDFKRIQRVEPVIKADELAYVTFERKDADRMVRFLTDFGLVPVEGTSGSFFFRGRGTNPFCVEIVPSDRDRLVGLGFMAKSKADLETLAAASGYALEDSDKPGGGKRVRLTDPDGSLVDVICGFTPATPLEARQDLLPANTPRDKRRINEGVRTPLAPTPIHRLGHVVLFTPDFAATTNWYMKWLGFLPTDILTPADGNRRTITTWRSLPPVALGCTTCRSNRSTSTKSDRASSISRQPNGPISGESAVTCWVVSSMTTGSTRPGLNGNTTPMAM
jgi:catechol 2,3-dioxygenase-like lactoylglutathione lyase family enzyme